MYNTEALLSAVNRARYEYGAKPRVHQNGFMQLDLDRTRTTRLHLWSGELPRQEPYTPIHDHEFGFESVVYLGKLCNKLYKVELVEAGYQLDDFALYRKWYLTRSATGPETTLEPTDQLYRATHIATQEVVAGQSYTMLGTKFHESAPAELSLTVMTKQFSILNHRACALVPKDQSAGNDFRRQAFAEQPLWDMIYDTVALIDR